MSLLYQLCLTIYHIAILIITQQKHSITQKNKIKATTTYVYFVYIIWLVTNQYLTPQY